MRILLVDDEKPVRQFLGQLLEHFGYEVATAADGQEALEKLEEERPFDLVITDLRMPRLDGLELLKAIRKRPNPPPVVLLTAFADMDTAVEAFQLGAADFINKPTRPAELQQRLERIERERALQRELEHEKEQRIRAETVREMVTTLAHELSNPLMTIMGNVDYLRIGCAGSEGSDDCREAFTGIRRNCARMARVVHRLQNVDEVRISEYMPGQLMVDTELSRCEGDDQPCDGADQTP